MACWKAARITHCLQKRSLAKEGYSYTLLGCSSVSLCAALCKTHLGTTRGKRSRPRSAATGVLHTEWDKEQDIIAIILCPWPCFCSPGRRLYLAGWCYVFRSSEFTADFTSPQQLAPELPRKPVTHFSTQAHVPSIPSALSLAVCSSGITDRTLNPLVMA